eukprot:m.20903 g.20903  ORF g.20903 m.20903 type:complete len:432 (-) comp6303_c0_seq1:108-1403(-)
MAKQDIVPAAADTSSAQAAAAANTPAASTTPADGAAATAAAPVAKSDTPAAPAASKRDMVVSGVLATLAAATVYMLGASGVSYGWTLLLALPVFMSVQHVMFTRRVRDAARPAVLEAREKSFPEVEEVEWINTLILLVWRNMSLYISDEVIKAVNPALKENCPAVLRKLEMTKFDLGTVPPALKSFKLDRTDKLKYILDLELVFRSDLKVGVTATTQVRVPLPLRVFNLILESAMRVEVEMLPNKFPLAKMVAVQMTKVPVIDVQIKPVGVNLTACPGLDSLLRKLIVGNVAAMFCPPNRFEVDLVETLGDDPSKAKEKLEEAKQSDSLFTKTAGSVGAGISSVGHFGGKLVGAGFGAGVGAVKGVGKLGGKAFGGAASSLGLKKKKDSADVGEETPSQSTEKQSKGGWSFRGKKNKKSSTDSTAERESEL